jgi:hypothetical protein
MVTADDIGRVTIFAALDPDARDRLARAAADYLLDRPSRASSRAATSDPAR